jgi:hypothetical protein
MMISISHVGSDAGDGTNKGSTIPTVIFVVVVRRARVCHQFGSPESVPFANSRIASSSGLPIG